MAKKKTDKAPSVATTTTDKAPTKKVAEKKIAKVSANGTVEVVVILKTFGTYKKGDVIVMHETTAKGCVGSGAVTYK